MMSALPADMSRGVAAAVSAESGVFAGFTHHIAQQISLDKRRFVEAELCTNWFYRQLRKPPAKDQFERTSMKSMNTLQGMPTVSAGSDLSECASLYPHGLDDARLAFSRTQGALSFSLTFYQFALVGDRDDDRAYSPQELQDVIESFGMIFAANGSSSEHLETLTRKFDSTREASEFSVLNKSMEVLYGKGYRFTRADQEALNRILG